VALGWISPPDTTSFIPSSTLISRGITSSSGTTIISPEVGLGVVGIKRVREVVGKWVLSSPLAWLVTKAMDQIPFLGYSTKTTRLNELVEEVKMTVSTSCLAEV